MLHLFVYYRVAERDAAAALEVIERDLDRDYYLDAQQAVAYGLVDQVLQVPEKK